MCSFVQNKEFGSLILVHFAPEQGCLPIYFTLWQNKLANLRKAWQYQNQMVNTPPTPSNFCAELDHKTIWLILFRDNFQQHKLLYTQPHLRTIHPNPSTYNLHCDISDGVFIYDIPWSANTL